MSHGSVPSVPMIGCSELG